MSAVRHGFVFLSGGSGERRRGCAEDGSNICGGFPDFAGGNCISERYELAKSGVPVVTLDLVGFVFCSSLFFSGDAAGGAGFSGEQPGRCVYRLDVKPGWFVSTTCFGGSAARRDSSSSGVLGLLTILGASDFSWSGDGMAIGHHFKPERSTSTKHVLDVLPKTATRNSVLQAADSGRRWQGTPGCVYKDLIVFFTLFKGVFVTWAVITKIINEIYPVSKKIGKNIRSVGHRHLID
jgi:hypothetical protein